MDLVRTSQKGLSLRKKIIMFIAIISIYPMILMGIIGAYNYNNIIKERFISYAQGNMNQLSTYINRDISDIKESVLMMLQDPSFYNMVLKQANIDWETIDMYSYRQEVRSYLSTIVFAKRNFDVGGLYFFEDDLNIFYPREAGIIQEGDIPIGDMTKLVEGTRGSQFYVIQQEEQYYIYLLQPLIHKDSFRQLGLIYFRIDPDYLGEFLKNANMKEDESIYLYTQEGRFISQEGREADIDLIEKKQYYQEEPGVYIEKQGQNQYYLITEEIKELKLTIITMISSRILTQDSRKVMGIVMFLYLINIPLFILMANFLHGNIIKPVNHLIKKMSRFEEGKLDTVINRQRKDEFGYLYTAFNKMTRNINSLVKDVYVEELARKDAEIAALQEQINPHFLYNTLESINWRAQLAGEQEIALMIQALSKLMDLSINRNQEKFTNLDQEIAYAQQYMFLIRMRYAEALVYEVETEPGLGNFLVPKLIVQPLLENAVKHGIEAVGEGKVHLRCYRKESKLFIEVEDNGQGMDEKLLDRIRRIFQNEQEISDIGDENRRSIGLQNVARRLYLIYNNRAEIQIQSARQKGTKITLIIPVEGQMQLIEESREGKDESI